jgi:hypothetical protein
MAATGFTPIQLYYSTTATNTPLAANLAVGELAVNAADGKLFYKNSATGLVSILANASSATGNLPGGGTGTVVYQSSTGVTAYLTLGTTNWIMTAGTTAPQYVNPSSVSVGYADAAGEASDIIGGAANRIVYQNATDSTDFITAPTIPGYVLSWSGAAFVWAPAPAATSAIDLAGGTTGSVPYQVAPGDTSFTPTGTAGYLLTSNGASAPSWTNPSTLSVSFATTAGSAGSATTAATATDVAGGTANQILYQTAPGNTDFLPVGLSGQVLTSQGAGTAPVWQDQVPAVTKSFVYFCAQF